MISCHALAKNYGSVRAVSDVSFQIEGGSVCALLGPNGAGKSTGAVYKLKRPEVQSRTDQLLRILRLEHGRRTFIQQCSYGMKKKTSLAMALLPNPQALFLDEPFEGVDPVTAETIRIQLRAMARRGVTVLLTSHILWLVDRVADQIVIINHGKVLLDSAVNDLPQLLESLYLELMEHAPGEDLQWIGSQQS
ncbi:MAG TPA: ABC transporter ATP-binding protein [Bryobacteraceae bacterium]|nr:ABC transporter ATP-binding protein [Bryobacteraceae bacterium]